MERFKEQPPLVWLAAVIVLVALVAFMTFVFNNGSLPVGPPLNGAGGGTPVPTATPQPTATPSAANLEPWFRQHPVVAAGIQDVATWHVAGCISACVRQTGTGFTPGADDLLVHPIYIGNAGTFGEIMVNVDTAVAATTARLGIYEGTFTDAVHEVYVGDLVEDYGTIDTSTTGTKQRLCTICATITPGLYFIALIVDDSSVRFERLDTGGMWAVPFGVIDLGTDVCAGWEVDNFAAAHTALPSVFPTPGPSLQCSSIGHTIWMGIEIND